MVRKRFCDCDYNLMKQMTKKLELLWYVDGYIADAEKDGHKECVRLFKEIKKDETRHVEKMRKLLSLKFSKRLGR